MGLDLDLLDTNGRLRRDDLWMRSRLQAAAYGGGEFTLDVKTDRAPAEEAFENTYDHFYNVRFARPYRIKELLWYTHSGPKPRARMLICIPDNDEAENRYVIFRFDANGALCAHAYGIAVTEAMMTFVKEQLPKLETLVKREANARKTEWKARRAATGSTVAKGTQTDARKPKRKKSKRKAA